MPWWCNPDKPFEDRLERAIHQDIRLLHRSGSKFFVLGHTKNVYIVTLSTESTCSCPDVVSPCKHLLFVYLQVVCSHTRCVRRSSLHKSDVTWLLARPMSRASLAEDSVRQWFHQLHPLGKKRQQQEEEKSSSSRPSLSVQIEDGSCCPICLDEIGKRDKTVHCGKCRNPMHEECFLKWERSARNKSAHCAICRTKWSSSTISRHMAQHNMYLNLAAYY